MYGVFIGALTLLALQRDARNGNQFDAADPAARATNHLAICVAAAGWSPGTAVVNASPSSAQRWRWSLGGLEMKYRPPSLFTSLYRFFEEAAIVSITGAEMKRLLRYREVSFPRKCRYTCNVSAEIERAMSPPRVPSVQTCVG
jgi:hypothetical protein